MNIQKKKLLLIEDDKIDQMAFKRFAKKKNFPYNFDISGSVKEAKEILKSKKYDVIVSDFHLGDGNAFELLKDLKDTPMVIATGLGDEELAVKAMKLGAYDYLIKDIRGQYFNMLPITVNNAISRFGVEQKLKEYHENLEVLVDERTAELKLEIAERIKAEETIRSSEERLKILFEYAPDAYFLSDLKGNFLDGNKAAEELIGYKKEEIIGTNIFNLGLLSKNQFPNVTKSIANNLLGKKSGPDELILNHKDGRKISVEINTFPVKIKNKTVVIGIAHDLTKRKQADEALRKSEEKYRNLIERANDGICIIQDGIVKFTNSRLSDLWGGESEDIIDAPFTNFIHPDEHKKLTEYYKRRIKGEASPSVYESVLLKKNGNIIQVELSAGIINYQGKPADMVIVRDISDRKQAEEALRESEELFAKLIASVPDIIIRTDINGNIVFCNETLLKLFPTVTFEDLLGKNMLSFFSEKDRSKAEKNTKLMFEQSLGVKEYQIQLANVIYDFEINGEVLRDASSKPIGMVYVLRDITDRKQAEKENIKLSTAVTQSPSVIAITDLRGNMEYVNPKFTELTGYTNEEAKGKNPRILKSGEQPDKMYKELWRTISSGKEWRGEFLNKKKNGELFWEAASVSPIFDKNGKKINYIKVAEDITERKQIDEKLKKRMQELEIFNNATVNREMKIIELKKEINKLLNESDEKPRYKIVT